MNKNGCFTTFWLRISSLVMRRSRVQFSLAAPDLANKFKCLNGVHILDAIAVARFTHGFTTRLPARLAVA